MPAPTDAPPPKSRLKKNPDGPNGHGDLRAKGAYAPDPHRMLPASSDAEQGVICSFLLAPREVGALCGEKRVRPESFHVPAHATIFEVLYEMWEKSKPIDIVTLTQTLHDRNVLELCGGSGFVSQLFTYLPTAANAEYYLEILQEKHTLREIIKVCTEYAARSYTEQENVTGLLDEAEAGILKIAESRYQAKAFGMKEHVMTAIGSIQHLYESRGELGGLSTGLAELDKLTDGLHPAEMIVIAARPSMGKTALAMNIAEHLAVEKALPIAVFSLEMSAQQLVQRLLCSRAKVNMSRVRDGFLTERDFSELTRAGSGLADSNMFIDDTAGLSIGELRAKARRLKNQHGIKAIFIDYLQLLRSTSRRAQDNRQLEIAEISSTLKQIAKELELPVVVLAQLNRNPEQRSGDSKGRPRLSDLRESGSIEQDADLVGLLVREEYYAENEEDKKEAEGKATLIIAKQRNGPVGDVKLTFLKEFTRFESRAEGSGGE